MAGASAVSTASTGSRALAAFVSFLREELAPRPGRLAGVLRITVSCCVVTAVVMVLQIPDPSFAVFLVFVVSLEDVAASVITGVAAVGSVTLAIALTIALTAFDAGSSALRLPVMALVTGCAMYASRAFRLGPVAFLVGFVLVKVQAAIDTAPNTEELVHGMLWLWVIIALPIGVVLLVQVATGQRPATMARQSALGLLRALADSLRRPGAGDLRSRHAAAVALVASTRRAAMVDATAKGHLGSNLRLVETLETLLSMRDVLPAETPPVLRGRLADECDVCAKAFERGESPPPPVQPAASERPVVSAMAAALERLRAGLDRRSRGLGEPMSHEVRPRLTDDRERTHNLKFALKSTLAVMSAYFICTGLALPEIDTAVSTCFIVALGSLGESVQKLRLRITGALVGGVAAGLCIAFVRPSMTDIGQLVLLVGAVTGICAWVFTSSRRLSYMGLQMALAFFYAFLADFAPPSHFKNPFYRVVGILLGNVLITVIFSSLWPTSAKERTRDSTDRALDDLAGFVGAGTLHVGARLAVLQSVDKARQFDAFAKFERGKISEAARGEVKRELSVPELERIVGLAFVAAETPGSPAIAGRLRGEDERAGRLLHALAHPMEVPSKIEPHPEVAVERVVGEGLDENATPSDRAALEARALLLSELERSMTSRLRLSLAAPWRAVLGALIVAQLACVTHELERAPASPEKAWSVPADSDYVQTLRETSHESAVSGVQGTRAPAVAGQPPPAAPSTDEQKSDAARENRMRFEPGRKYGLAELIDVAERHHPDTREAWEQARQAALAVGVAEATYLPELSAKVVAGYQRTPFPIPQSVVPSGVMNVTTVEAIPLLAAKWLLFDFGKREAGVQEAEAKSIVANVTFTEAHEKVVFGVSHDYFALDAARASVRVAQQAAENARRTQEISEAKRAQGVATVVDVAQAARQTAQARYDVVKAQGAERNAYSALIASMGIDPSGALEVADSGDRPLPAAPMEGLNALLEAALANRPDVVAALGKVRAAEAGLKSARAAYWPTIDINAQVYENLGAWNVGTGFFKVISPGWNALLGIGLPIFDGGAREAKTAIAHSEVSAARAALDGARDKAALEVTAAYDKLQTSFAEYKAAVDAEKAAQTALDAAAEAYRGGVGPLTDALTAQNAARESQLQKETARASVFTSAAELAFALGAATRQ